MRGWRLGGAGLRCYPGSNNTRQGYALRSTLKPAGYFFCVEVESASGKRYINNNTPAKPMPTDVGTLKSRGFYAKDLNWSDFSTIVRGNTPAMPLTEAHFGGFFVSGGR